MRRLTIFLLATVCFHVCSLETKASDTWKSVFFSTPPAIDSYRVVGIKDGDTFVVLMNGREQDVRLEHIDCPERGQAFGKRAKEFASDLCFDKYVTLVHNNNFDRYGRLIAEVVLTNGTNVNKSLVSIGLAWHFKKYSKSQEYGELEMLARSAKVGIWSQPNPEAPWEYRKKN